MKENRNLEFKEIISKTFLKTVSAYANFQTGEILFGVTDDGKIAGIQNPDHECLNIENAINDSIKPKPDFLLSIDRNTGVIRLSVKEGLFKPYLYKGKAYKRSDTATVELDQIELKRLVLLGENLYFEELPAKEQNLSFDYLFQELTKKLSITDTTKNIDILKTLGLLNNNLEYNNAAYLLSDMHDFPGIDIVRFGNSINEIEYRETIERTSILKQLERVEQIFSQYYKVEEVQGMKRKEKYFIPLEAFREVLANALVHRTWDISSHVRVAMYDDRIEVYSPGGLPIGLTKEEYLNGYVSNLRNPLIANVFFRLDIIEQFGTGIMKIKKLYYEILHKPIFNVTENSIITILPTDNKREDLTMDEHKVLESLPHGLLLASSEIVVISGYGKDKVLDLLSGLIEKRYVEKIGTGRGTKYKRI